MGVPLLRPRMAGTGAAPARALPLLHAAEVGGDAGRRRQERSPSMSKPNEDLTAAKAHEALVTALRATQRACMGVIGLGVVPSTQPEYGQLEEAEKMARAALALAEVSHRD